MPTEDDASFADLLLRYRREAGLTQGELAQRTQVGVRTIGNLERGTHSPQITTLTQLADALHLDNHQRKTFLAAARRSYTEIPLPPPTRQLPPLPLPLTRLIGRDREIADIFRLILEDQARLVTLTGTAGIGKTRLALDIASQLAPAFPDGVAFISLAHVQDWHLIPHNIAQTLGIQEEPKQSLWDIITTNLATKTALLVLDNLEHLLEGAALVADLLLACPSLVIMTTSRAALQVRGERRYRVPPLDCASDGEHGNRSAATDLFVERARGVQPLLPLTPTNMMSITAICERLDGIPLAIELAAMRVSLLSLPDLLQRLDHRLSLLVMGARDLPSRQQTMRDAIAWSYDLLSPSEQAVFRRLAVFVGGWTLAAADALCDNIGEDDVLMILAVLVDANLIRREIGDDREEPRYAMLEILREFGLEQLAAHNELAGMQQCHAAYMLALVQTAEPALRGPMQGQWLRWLEDEHNNVRAALQWARDHDAALGLSMTKALWRFWYGRQHLSEGFAWITEFLGQAQSGSKGSSLQKQRAHASLIACNLAALLGKNEQAEHLAEASFCWYQEEGDIGGMCSAMSSFGNIALFSDRYRVAEERFRQALTLSRSLGDKARMALALHNLACMDTRQGRYPEAHALFEESLIYQRELGNHDGIAIDLISLSSVLYKEEKYESAIAITEESLIHARKADNQSLVASGLDSLGRARAGQGDYGQALVALEQSRQIFAELLDRHNIATVLRHMGDVASDQGELQQAEANYSASLALYKQAEEKAGIAKCLVGQAIVLLARGQAVQAACYVRTAGAMCNDIGISPQAAISLRLERTKHAIREALGVEAFQAAWDQSKTLSVEDILNHPGMPSPAKS